jgi:tellurite resistance protein
MEQAQGDNMAERAHPRPKIYPPPEFPPRRPGRFARTPPAVFPVILGLLGLGLALRRGLEAAGLPSGLADLVLGAVAVLWGFAVFAYLAKMARRASVVLEDLRVLPGRAGLAAMTMGALALAAVVAPMSVPMGRAFLVVGLVGHGLVLLATLRVLWSLSPEARGVTPAFHLTFVGFIVGGLAAPVVGWEGLARALLWGTMPLAAVIWGVSAVQLVRRIPPAPLRPLLAIHLAPASLFALVSAGIGMPDVALGFVVFGTLILLGLIGASRWIAESGFSALWASMTFPLAAYSSALFAVGFDLAGMAALLAALGLVPWIAWRVITLWGSGRLAAVTNAAEV